MIGNLLHVNKYWKYPSGLKCFFVIKQDSSHKNENSIIIYSPSCCSKPVWPDVIPGGVEAWAWAEQALFTDVGETRSHCVRTPLASSWFGRPGQTGNDWTVS